MCSATEPLMTVDELIEWLQSLPDGKASVWINAHAPAEQGRPSSTGYGWLRAARIDPGGDPAFYVSTAWADHMCRPDAGVAGGHSATPAEVSA